MRFHNTLLKSRQQEPKSNDWRGHENCMSSQKKRIDARRQSIASKDCEECGDERTRCQQVSSLVRSFFWNEFSGEPYWFFRMSDDTFSWNSFRSGERGLPDWPYRVCIRKTSITRYMMITVWAIQTGKKVIGTLDLATLIRFQWYDSIGLPIPETWCVS